MKNTLMSSISSSNGGVQGIEFSTYYPSNIRASVQEYDE